MYKAIALGMLFVAINGCGNHDNISDEQRIAELREKRESYNRTWEDAQRNVDARIQAERGRLNK